MVALHRSHGELQKGIPAGIASGGRLPACVVLRPDLTAVVWLYNIEGCQILRDTGGDVIFDYFWFDHFWRHRPRQVAVDGVFPAD